MNTLYLALGSNIGDTQKNIDTAIEHLQKFSEVTTISSMYTTEPVGYADQDWFLNCCIEVQTELPPQEFLKKTQRIEEHMGRVKKIHNGPRIIDIDILLYEDLILDTEHLIIPHPRMCDRAFVLEPLNDIAAEVIHPVLQISIQECKNRLRDSYDFKKV